VDTSPTPLVDLAAPPLTPFAALPAAAQAELAACRASRRFASGEVIVREGEPGDSCFVVASGLVRTLRRDPERDGATSEIGRLGAGELFGDFALLADRRRHATVQAVENTELFEIPRRVLRELAATWPGVGAELERLYRERLLAAVLQNAPFFRPLPFEQRGALLARFVAVRVDAGEAILREGERGGGLYIIVLGSVEVTKRTDGGRAVLLATLGEGAYFGEMSLLSSGLALATVTAAGPTELAELPRDDFHAAVSRVPALWDEARREAKRRELANHNILAGESTLV
jgi:cAMP-dependent protein kinase regulator